MKRLLAVLLCGTLVLGSSTGVYAEENKPATNAPIKLEAGKPFTPKEDGWYFTVPQEQQIRFHLIEADYLKKELSLSKDSLEHLQTQIELHKQIEDRYRQAWLQSEDQLLKTLKQENKSKFLYITLGVLLTIGAGLAIGYAAHAVK